MKTVQEIVEGLDYRLLGGSPKTPVSQVSQDSRNITPGTLFVAIPGTQVDGHRYIAQAVSGGAVAVVCEVPPEERSEGICWIQVSHAARALGLMAAAFYQHPTTRMKVVGVTGTNGKTTVATLLHRLFNKMGRPSGLVSTVEYCIGNEVVPATHTTPDSVSLNRLFARMLDQGIQYCFMEVSSHALVQERTAGIEFTGGIFTNITHDHLDYHHSFREYIGAKKKFFDELPAGAFALVNRDDRNAGVMVQNTKARKLGYALKTMAEYRSRLIESHLDGMQLQTDGKDWWSRLIGSFNASNLTAVYAAAVELSADKTDVIRLLSEIEPVRGRFETIHSTDGRVGVVDYAHTPDALENILHTLVEVKTHARKLITVVGAGGDRDRTKRPLMAGIAARLSDRLILTSDNPRSENPDDIIEEMMKGIETADRPRVLQITSRSEAIRTACMMAERGDIILVAGKGHENYQEIKGVKYPFDDLQVLAEVFSQIN